MTLVDAVSENISAIAVSVAERGCVIRRLLGLALARGFVSNVVLWQSTALICRPVVCRYFSAGMVFGAAQGVAKATKQAAMELPGVLMNDPAVLVNVRAAEQALMHSHCAAGWGLCGAQMRDRWQAASLGLQECAGAAAENHARVQRCGEDRLQGKGGASVCPRHEKPFPAILLMTLDGVRQGCDCLCLASAARPAG